MSEIIVATRTAWYHRSAFKAWVKDSLTTLSAVPIVDVAGWVTWKNALVVAILMLEERALADRAADDTKPIDVPASVRMAMRGHR